MKNLLIHSLAAISGFVCLVSCSEPESVLQSETPSSDNLLRVVTHTREGDEPATPLASVYLFDASNKLVRTLETDAAGDYTTASSSVKLPEGSYTLCALNASDLAHFQIPDNPTPTSAITQAEGQDMGDLLMATATASLDDGESKVVSMTLLRKVLELSTISITQVPAEVDGVTVSISPFYSAVQLNGVFVDTDPATCSFTLTDAGSGTWQAEPQQLVFPSNGTPTITVTFTCGTENTHYAYTAESPLTANNKYNIAGTYTEPLGVTLTGAITFQSWATDPTAVAFSFDHNNATSTPDSPTNPTTDPTSTPSDPPVAGELYNGCYVVSVDEEHETAVLLSPTEENKKYTLSSADNTGWLTCIDSKLTSWTAVNEVTGTWRLPSQSEVEYFAYHSDFLNGVSKKIVFFKDGTYLKAARYTQKTNVENAYEMDIISNASEFSSNIFLRPVIDITY